jgi:NADH-quinone oxidoreductase subunit C
LRFDLLLSVTVVDYLSLEGNKEFKERYEVVYHLLSLANRYRLRVKVWVPEEPASVDSITHLWTAANFMEREAWDMYGVKFTGHPDLRRILMYDEFVGHPLRKDYPLQGKQPRIRMLSPEVRNTAVDMVRAPLISINRKKQKEAKQLSH